MSKIDLRFGARVVVVGFAVTVGFAVVPVFVEELQANTSIQQKEASGFKSNNFILIIIQVKSCGNLICLNLWEKNYNMLKNMLLIS